MLIHRERVNLQRSKISSYLRIIEHYMDLAQTLSYAELEEAKMLEKHILHMEELSQELKNSWDCPDEFIIGDIANEFKTIQKEMNEKLSHYM